MAFLVKSMIFAALGQVAPALKMNGKPIVGDDYVLTLSRATVKKLLKERLGNVENDVSKENAKMWLNRSAVAIDGSNWPVEKWMVWSTVTKKASGTGWESAKICKIFNIMGFSQKLINHEAGL